MCDSSDAAENRMFVFASHDQPRQLATADMYDFLRDVQDGAYLTTSRYLKVVWL